MVCSPVGPGFDPYFTLPFSSVRPQSRRRKPP